MVIYWVLFFSILILGICGCFLGKEAQKYILIIQFIIVTSFQGLRWNTGADWFQFYWYFDNMTWNIFSFLRWDRSRILEPGYACLNIIIKTIYDSYSLFLIVTCAFVNISYYKLVKKLVKKDITLIYAIVLLSAPIFPVRQQLAAAIFLWGIEYIVNRKFKNFCFVVAIATTIHFSSIILIRSCLT